MKKIMFLFLLTSVYNLSAQVDGEEFTIEKFGWTVRLPEGFEIVDTKEWNKIQNRGADILGKHLEADLSEAVEINETLLLFASGTHNVFEVSQQPYDVAIDGKLVDTNKEIAKLLAEAFEDQLPGTVVTTKFSTEEIGGKTFYKTTLVAKYDNGGQFVAYMYNRLFGKTEFCINIMYLNPIKGKKMLDAVKASTFKK